MPLETARYEPAEPLWTQFLPAESKQEAVARLYAIAGATPEPLGPGSKEKKSVLLGLAAGLDIPIDTRLPKSRFAAMLTESLGGEWTDDCWSAGNTITLSGLNLLLERSTRAFSDLATQRVVEQQLARAIEREFTPARSKIEAVNRISALTRSGPEVLGPGSKERKSVLVNAARGLGLDIDTALNKVELGRALADQLGLSWTAQAFSTGHTITLHGLNIVLEGAETRLGLAGHQLSDTFADPVAEADALIATLADAIPDQWDGREMVTRMRDAEYRNWRQTEWAGWFFEFIGIPALIDAFGGGRAKFNNTEFDYQLRSVWDLKAHDRQGGASRTAILNDHRAVVECLDAGHGLGFLVLSGEADYTGHERFAEWRREFCATGRPERPKVERAFSRRLKSAFAPTLLQAFRLENSSHLGAAIAAGQLKVLAQGRQQGGQARNPKVHLDFSRASKPGGLLISERPCGGAGRLLL